MKKYLIGTSVALLLTPIAAFAAYNDVTLTTDTVLTVNSVTLNVSGSSGVVESAVVNTGNVVFTLLAGSSLEVTAPNLEVLSADTTTSQVTNVCTGSLSKLGYNGAVTVTITPQSTLCASASGGGGSSGGGGGGGSSTTSTTVAATTTSTTATATTTTATTATATTGTTQTTGTTATQTSAASPEMLVLINQLRSLIAVLKSLGGTVSPELEATINALAPASTSFTRDLEVGSTGEDVRALQQFLNARGYQVSASGPGSSGNETTTFGGLTRAALAQFQAANGITPSVGYFGPKTRAFIAGM